MRKFKVNKEYKLGSKVSLSLKLTDPEVLIKWNKNESLIIRYKQQREINEW